MSSFDNSMEQIPGENWEKFMSYMRGEHDEVNQQRQQFQNGANMHTENTPNLPYRLAHQIQESIIHQVEMNDYYVGQAERDDMATDIAYQWYNSREVDPPELALDALMHWRRIFRGHHG